MMCILQYHRVRCGVDVLDIDADHGAKLFFESGSIFIKCGLNTTIGCAGKMSSLHRKGIEWERQAFKQHTPYGAAMMGGGAVVRPLVTLTEPG